MEFVQQSHQGILVKLRALVDSSNQNRAVKISYAIGYESTRTIDFINKADKQMYENKKHVKEIARRQKDALDKEKVEQSGMLA